MHTQLYIKPVLLAFAAGAVTATLVQTSNSWATSPTTQVDATRLDREARTAAARAISTPPAEHQDLTY